MTRIERSIYVEATSDEIDIVSLDPQRTTEWYEGLVHFEADDLYPETGAKGRGTLKTAGLTVRADVYVVERVPNHHFTYSLSGGMDGEFHWTHTPEGSGTRVTLIAEYELPGGALGKIADKLVVERAITADIEKSLENMKRLSEQIHEAQAHA